MGWIERSGCCTQTLFDNDERFVLTEAAAKELGVVAIIIIVVM